MDDGKKKKLFVDPEAIIVVFDSDDIITLSNDGLLWWGHGNEEDF